MEILLLKTSKTAFTNILEKKAVIWCHGLH